MPVERVRDGSADESQSADRRDDEHTGHEDVVGPRELDHNGVYSITPDGTLLLEDRLPFGTTPEEWGRGSWKGGWLKSESNPDRIRLHPV